MNLPNPSGVKRVKWYRIIGTTKVIETYNGHLALQVTLASQHLSLMALCCSAGLFVDCNRGQSAPVVKNNSLLRTGTGVSKMPPPECSNGAL